MKGVWKCAALCICLFVLCGLGVSAQAEAFSEDAQERVTEVSDLVATLPVKGGYAEVRGTIIEETTWLFLPAFADLDTMTLSMNGEVVSWENVSLEGDQWTGEAANAAGEVLFELRVMQSANLRALFLFSDDPVNRGRAYIDNTVKHETETTGTMAIVSEDARVDYAGRMKQLRGRGNYSWKLEKKPYQFKLEDKVDLLQTGEPSERNRTWVLLAEMADGTFLHNRIALDLGLEMGIEETSHSEFVDLYYDGEYRGGVSSC